MIDLTKTLHWNDTDVEVHKVVVGPYDNNVFVVRCRHTGDAVLLDAANEHDMLLELARELGVRTVLETHGHWDHIQAVPAIRDAGYEVGVTAADAAMLPSYDYILEDDTMIAVGRARLHTITTPATPLDRSVSSWSTSRCCSPATPCSREDRGTPRETPTTSPRSSSRSTIASSRTRQTRSFFLATATTRRSAPSDLTFRTGSTAVGDHGIRHIALEMPFTK